MGFAQYVTFIIIHSEYVAFENPPIQVAARARI